MRPQERSDLPPAVAAFIDATNAGRLDAIVETFGEEALVNDQLREYADKSAIADWAAREVIGQSLALEVQSVAINHEQTVVRAKVDGSFDRRGLPDPLIVSFYFSSHAGKIVQLLILRAEPGLDL